jgi:dihydrofolate synthase/folylpolyglutamate synthase
MKFGLENISRLCAALDHPERQFQSVIVAGTNGKGSVAAMVHRGLTAAGHRTGRYTSPHLERIEERYVVGDREVDSAELEAAARIVRDAVERLLAAGAFDAPPTFFECATAIAFVLFQRAGVRVAVLEVGLGGRLDATNVVTPIAAAITSIDFDHQAQLGNTIESIAFEKAGVIKPGIPVVCGPLPAEAERVVRGICADRAARFVMAPDVGEVDAIVGDEPLALRGAHQRQNAAIAAALLRELVPLGIAIDADAIRTALTDVEWPGRLERFTHHGAEVLVDAAHNPAGARALAAYLRERGTSTFFAETDEKGARPLLLFGAMQDKDVGAMLAELASVCDTLIATTAGTPRAMDAEAVAAVARSLPGATWTVTAVADPAEALDLACRRSPRVVAAGSIFLIGPLRGILRRR